MRLILHMIQMKEEVEEEDEKTQFFIFSLFVHRCVCVFAPEKLDVKVISHAKNEWRITVA